MDSKELKESWDKITTIIEFLKLNGGYDCKFTSITTEPLYVEYETNIVEIAEDIRFFLAPFYFKEIDEQWIIKPVKTHNT